MGRGNEEKLFSENIDRLLAGEEMSSGAEMDNDFRTALDFARKMARLRPAPSPAFQANLKARLLQKLNEPEAPVQHGWFWRWLFHEPVWQTVTALVVMVIVGGVVWGTLFRPSPPVLVAVPTVTPAITTAPATAAPTTAAATATTAPTTIAPVTSIPGTYLTANAATDKTTYAPGQPVNLEVSLKNVTSQPFTLAQFPPILSLMQSSSGQAVYTFPAGNKSRTLAPGETVQYPEVWNQKDDKGRMVSPGTYYLELEDIDYQGRRLELNLTQPVSFNIAPTASTNGASKILEVSQSRTVNGLTVTLKTVELGDNGMIVTAFITPPSDYVLLPGTPALSATNNYQSSADYSIDGSWMESAGLSSVEYFADGMVHTWNIPETVPQDASEMTFTVNSVGSLTGPWQFQISLR